VQKANWPGRGGPKVRSWLAGRVCSAPAMQRPGMTVPGTLRRQLNHSPKHLITRPQGGESIVERLDTEEVVDKLPIDQLAPPVPEVVRCTGLCSRGFW
jgi:hypothetical protein